MKKHDMDFIVRFAAASSAALILSGCDSGEPEVMCLYGPPPDSRQDIASPVPKSVPKPVPTPVPKSNPTNQPSTNNPDSDTAQKADSQG